MKKPVGSILSLPAIPLLLLSIGCSAPRWDGTVDRWGTLREVLRDGDDAGKVEVVRVLTSRHVHGVGAVEGLLGEIAIADGVAWISRATSPGTGISSPAVTPRLARPGDRAALLVIAEVPRWEATTISAPVSDEGLSAQIAARIAGTRLERSSVVPVRVEGRFAFSGHVLAGQCPYATETTLEPGPGHPPVEVIGQPVAERTIVGFYADLPPGEMTHHGSQLHLHALDVDGTVCHIDRFTLERGCRILLPAVD